MWSGSPSSSFVYNLAPHGQLVCQADLRLHVKHLSHFLKEGRPIAPPLKVALNPESAPHARPSSCYGNIPPSLATASLTWCRTRPVASRERRCSVAVRAASPLINIRRHLAGGNLPRLQICLFHPYIDARHLHWACHLASLYERPAVSLVLEPQQPASRSHVSRFLPKNFDITLFQYIHT